MYIVITGAAGFIGSNLVRALNQRGETDIIAVDDLSHGEKFRNLVGCEIADFVDKDEFLQDLGGGRFDGALAAVLHQGACSDTTATDGRMVMSTNYRYSLALLDYCQEEQIPYVFASSAAVYGGRQGFRESPDCESPLNLYGYSKQLFDQVVRRRASEFTAPVVGLRYFNVYGPREQHKGRMASVAMHLFHQFRATGKVRLFRGTGGYADGEQRRDFVSVDDVVQVNLHFLGDPGQSGIFNVGTGAAQSFNDVAMAVVNACRAGAGESPLALHELQTSGAIEYIPFPADLRGKYQNYTQADLTQLRSTGYRGSFSTVERGVARYVEHLLAEARGDDVD